MIGVPGTSALRPPEALRAVAIVAGVLTWRRQRWAPLLTSGVGLALLIWMGVEVASIGYASDPPLQPIDIGLGVAISLVGITWLRQTGLPCRVHGASRTRTSRLTPSARQAHGDRHA